MIEIDSQRLRHELEQAKDFEFVEPYEEFLCGRPTRHEGQIMLWAPGGRSGDGVITHYDNAAADLTEYGRRLPCLAELVERWLAVQHLRFARLVALTSNVLVPHRDYLEFEDSTASRRPVHRLHIPLITNPDCMFSEGNTVYRMHAGEVWFLDATEVHSAAALTDEVRMHLIVDFTDVADRSELVNFEISADEEIPPANIVAREPLPESERHALHGLADLTDRGNYREVFAIIAKKHFRYDGGEHFFWNTVEEIRSRVADPETALRLAELHDHFLLNRAE
jgi:hypothetical protein